MPVPTPEQFHAYVTIHEQIAAAIAGLTPAQMQASPAKGDWSIHQVLIHLADSEAVVGYERMRRIIAEERPLLLNYDEEAWARELGYHQQDPYLSLELFKQLRQVTAALLRRLPAATWERSGLHSQNGAMTLYDVFHILLRHGEAHRQQIEDLKRCLTLT